MHELCFALQTQELDISEMHHRRALVERANQLSMGARTMASKSSDKRNISEFSEWQEAMEILQQLRASIGPLYHKWRSEILKPSVPLDTLIGETLLEAVAEAVSTRRQPPNIALRTYEYQFSGSNIGLLDPMLLVMQMRGNSPLADVFTGSRRRFQGICQGPDLLP
jgi:hypothetical protein